MTTEITTENLAESLKTILENVYAIEPNKLKIVMPTVYKILETPIQEKKKNFLGISVKKTDSEIEEEKKKEVNWIKKKMNI